MIKKIKKIFQPYMIRPIVYQCVTKISIALALALLWNRFINVEGIFSIVRDAFFVLGVLFVMLAWFQYLRLDDLKMSPVSEGERKKKKRHRTRDIVDYADEKIVSFSELEEEERTVCRLLENIICGILFLIPALAGLLLI